MDRQAQIDFILDHYENPRNYGRMDGATVVGRGDNPGCGDALTLYLQIDDDARIVGVSFEGQGCTISMAGASVVTDLLKGRTVAEVEATSADRVLELLGRELVATRLKCAILGLATAREAVRAFRGARTREADALAA